jgi:hypothetical protein
MSNKTDWKSEFQKISASSASFGSDFEHPLEREVNKHPFNEMIPDGATRRPDYDIFGAVAAGRSRKKKPILTTKQRRGMSQAAHTAHQAGMGSDMGAAGGGGGKGGGGGTAAPRAPAATSPSSSYSVPTGGARPAAPTGQARPTPPTGGQFIPAPTGQAFNPIPGHGLVPPSYSGGTYAYGYPTNRMSPERMMRIEARQVAERYREAGQIAEAEAIEAQYDDLYALEDDDFSGDAEKSGLPAWLLALLGIFGIYLGAEYLSSRVKRTPESHRFSA